MQKLFRRAAAKSEAACSSAWKWSFNMAYCTQADIEKLVPEQELAELTTESGDIADADVVAEAIAKADALIDSYCGQQYSVPFSQVTEIIESWCVDIAVYRLYLRRRVVPDPARPLCEYAISCLKDVSKGNAVVGSTTSPPDSVAGNNDAPLEYNDRVFT